MKHCQQCEYPIRDGKGTCDKTPVTEELMPADHRRLVRDLIDVGTGKIPHKFMGQCPDSVDGHNQRDKLCRACRILIRAKYNIANAKSVSTDASGKTL